MRWARVSSVTIALACSLVILANVPAIVMDPLATALAQIRANAAKTETSSVNSLGTENPYPNEVPVERKTRKAP